MTKMRRGASPPSSLKRSAPTISANKKPRPILVCGLVVPVCQGHRVAKYREASLADSLDFVSESLARALVLQVVIEFQVVHLLIRTDALEGLVHRIRKHEQAELMLIDRAPALHGAPIEDLVPVAPAIDQNQVAAWEFAGLHQREHLPELVHGAEAAGENNQGLGQLGKPKLAHEEVMEIEAELRADEGVGHLLVRQLDAQADGFAAGFGGAAVGRLHDAGTAA